MARGGDEVQLVRDAQGGRGRGRAPSGSSPLSGSPHPSCRHQRVQHHTVVEVLPRDVPRGLLVPDGIGEDRVQRRSRRVEIVEGHQAHAGRESDAESRVLCHHRSTRGQIGRASVAEPAAPESDVLVLRHRELAGGGTDVGAIEVGVGGECVGVPHPPATVGETAAIRVGDARQRELQVGRGPLGKVDHRLELVVLAPRVGLAAEPQITDLLSPVPDRGERPRIRPVAPEVHHHGLPCGTELESICDGEQTVGLAVVLPEREVMRVGAQELDRRLVLVEDLHLQLDRIGADEGQSTRSHVLGPGNRPTVQVEEDLGGLVQRRQCACRHPQTTAVRMERVVGPAVAEAEAGEEGVQVRCRSVRSVIRPGAHEQGRRAGVRLDVVGVVPQPTEPLQVVNGLPDHAADRHLRHHAQDDHLGRTEGDHDATSMRARRGCWVSAPGRGRPVCISWSCA